MGHTARYAEGQMATYLDNILVAHRKAAQNDSRDLTVLRRQVEDLLPARGFAAALRSGKRQAGVAVIAEVKRRSPSKGALAPGLVPSVLAKAYEEGGAACLSVLTDEEFFGGSVADLQQARQAVALPVLRKDFTVSCADVVDARLMGADAVLLIASALDDFELRDFLALAREVGLDALVEVHDETEAERAVGAGATLVGVNQRDLFSFEVDTRRAVRVGRHLPAHVVRVAESGIKARVDVEELAAAGFDAILVGEALVTAPDAASALRALAGAEA
jgi:indole-3-glycerol phosphate synthase